MDAGEMRDRVERLRLVERAGEFLYEPAARGWAKATLQAKSNLFSSVGVGARGVELIMRRGAAPEPGGMLRWMGNELFVSSVVPYDRLHDTVACAIVELADCVADAGGAPQGVRFPGILTEKYVRYGEVDVVSQNAVCYVLVTPKNIVLQRGSLVEVSGALYHVLLEHPLDKYKNEYEILRTEDL